jgi:hypothetical protein
MLDEPPLIVSTKEAGAAAAEDAMLTAGLVGRTERDTAPHLIAQG